MSKKKKEIISKSAEVAGVLVDKLSGILPAVAEAKVEAEEIKLRGMIKQDDIARRAGYRILRQQGNIEGIAQIAGEMIPSDSEHQARDMDEDWAADFAEKCKNISNKEMQLLWAKILAGEAGKPGSFSKSTVDVVGALSQKDAQMFTDFCQFVWTNNEGRATPLIYDWHHPIYQSPDHFFDTVKQLTHLRLLFLDSVAGYINVFDGPSVCWAYQDISVRLNLPSGDPVKYKDSLCPMNLGHVTLTEAGEQLCSICGAKTNNSFFLYILEKWEKWGYNPSVVQEKGAEE